MDLAPKLAPLLPDSPPATTPSRLWRWAGRLADAFALAAGIFFVAYFSYILLASQVRYVHETDSEGFFMIGKAFSEGRLPLWHDDFARFRSHMWIDRPNDMVTCKYSPGWPLLLAAGYLINGLPGALAVNTILGIIAAVALLVLTWELFRGPALAIVPAVFLFAPLIPYYSAAQMSHVPDLAVTLLAFLFAVYWAKTGWTTMAALTGFFVGFAPLVRPTSIFIWPAVAVLFLVTRHGTLARRNPLPKPSGWRESLARLFRPLGAAHTALRRHPWTFPMRAPFRPYGLFALTLALPLAFWAYYNATLYGRPWLTGYALSDEQFAFSYTDFAKRFNDLLPLRTMLLADRYWILILVAVLFRRGRPGLLTALLLWFFPTYLVYIGYYFFMTNMAYARFYISILPAAVLAIGFLTSHPRLTNPIISVLLTAAFVTWFLLQPPEVLRAYWHPPKTPDVHAVNIDARLNLLPAWARDNPAQETFALIRHTPSAVYASNSIIHFTANSTPGSVSYDLTAWTDSHYSTMVHPNWFKYWVREDVARHWRIHRLFQSLGPSGLREDFLAHIRADLAAGRQVLLVAGKGEAPARWLASDSHFALQPVNESARPPIYRVAAAETP